MTVLKNDRDILRTRAGGRLEGKVSLTGQKLIGLLVLALTLMTGSAAGAWKMQDWRFGKNRQACIRTT